MERTSPNSILAIGNPLPKFSLLSTTGETISDAFFDNQPGLVVFACNHCPYVLGSIDMILHTIRTYQEAGLKAVIISSNDPIQYPSDDFAAMKDYAETKNFPCPYLFDESQEVAKSFDAQCTPESFLFNKNKKLVYHGAVNDSHRDPSKVTINFLDKAISSLLNGKDIEPNFNRPIGCSIKWKL